MLAIELNDTGLESKPDQPAVSLHDAERYHVQNFAGLPESYSTTE
jgi:hypothetical protein